MKMILNGMLMIGNDTCSVPPAPSCRYWPAPGDKHPGLTRLPSLRDVFRYLYGAPSGLFLLLLFLLPLLCAAQDRPQRPVYSAYMWEIGSASVAETYLSPLKYTGWSTALSYERRQAMRFDPQRWEMRLGGRLDLERTLNPPGNVVMWGADLDLRWGMSRRWALDGHWRLLAGGYTGAQVGALYNTRNGNNPVAAKASWTIGPSVGAAFTSHIGRIPISARYTAEMPLTGVFFAPQYGELYYEIYLGNHHGLVRAAWPGNYFRLDQLATVDVRFGATIVRLGYRCGIHSSKASHIVTERVSHTFVLGIASEWLSLSARHDKNVISVY